MTISHRRPSLVDSNRLSDPNPLRSTFLKVPIASLCLTNLTYRRCFKQPHDWVDGEATKRQAAFRSNMLGKDVGALDVEAYLGWVEELLKP